MYDLRYASAETVVRMLCYMIIDNCPVCDKKLLQHARKIFAEFVIVYFL